MNKIFAPFLPPWVETGLQPAFYDMESGTVLQQTARMYAKVQQLTRLFNEFSEDVSNEVNNFEHDINETVQEYIDKFVELKDFVEDYFDNLDVQEEINNKLDAMVEDGTMQELINTALQPTKALYTYNTLALMSADTNLVNGSFAKTIGYYNANDGGGATYKIRTKGDEEVADGAFTIAIGDSLIAELVPSNDTVNFRQLGAKSEEDSGYAHVDCKPYLDKYLAKLDDLDNQTLSLYIPSGIWCFSETLLKRDHGFNIYGEKSFVISTEGTENTTIIAPVSNNQKHLWKIGGDANYSGSATLMVYNWNLNNLVFSTGRYSSGRTLDTVYHVTRASLYLDGVTAGRAEFLQFDQVDGTALGITSSWENYFGTLNFRRVYDFSTPAMLFDSVHPITGAGSPDISSTNIDNMMFEGINGDFIYSATDSNLAELQIGNMNLESRLVQANGTLQGTIVTNNSSKTADNHCSVFNVGQALGIMINQIKMGNFVNYKFTATEGGATYINDRLFTFRENSFFQIAVNSIITNGSRASLTVAYKPDTYMVNQRSRIVINNYLAYGELVSSNLPDIDVKYFPYIQINNVVDGMSVVRGEAGAIPLYPYCISSGNNQYLYKDSGAENPLHLACRRTTSANQAFCQLTANPNYDVIVRFKAKTGVNGRISYRCTKAADASESYNDGPTYTGDDTWQYLQLNLPALKTGTRLVLVDAYSGYSTNDDVTIFDSITLVPRSE